MKNLLFNENNMIVSKLMSFEEVYEAFFKSMQDETWKMVKTYTFARKDEVEQQFAIELWNAYETYDISKGQCFSTHLYWRFKLARKKIIDENIRSASAKFEKSSMTSMDANYGESENSFSNQAFYDDTAYQQMENSGADLLMESSELMSIILDKFKNCKEKIDLIRVIVDKKEYSVAIYAEEYGISRMAANKRVNKMKEQLKEIVMEEWL